MFKHGGRASLQWWQFSIQVRRKPPTPSLTMTQEKPKMTIEIYASLKVALKRDKKFAEEQLENSSSAYWQGVIQEINTAIQYVEDTI